MRLPSPLICLLMIALHAATAIPAQAQPGTAFVVIVNEENDYLAERAVMISFLSRLYLKHQTSWPNGSDVIVFTRPEDSAENTAFRHAILGKTDTELRDHWLKQKQMRGESPPRAISSTRIILRQVNMKPGSVSIITKSDFDAHTQSFDHVRVLYTFYGASDE